MKKNIILSIVFTMAFNTEASEPAAPTTGEEMKNSAKMASIFSLATVPGKFIKLGSESIAQKIKGKGTEKELADAKKTEVTAADVPATDAPVKNAGKAPNTEVKPPENSTTLQEDMNSQKATINQDQTVQQKTVQRNQAIADTQVNEVSSKKTSDVDKENKKAEKGTEKEGEEINKKEAQNTEAEESELADEESLNAVNPVDPVESKTKGDSFLEDAEDVA